MTANTMNRANSTAADTPGQAATVGPNAWFAAGGVLGALAASSCCVAPVALFLLGVGGAWIGNLTALAPYQPIFIVATLGFLAVGYYYSYRKSVAACARGGACARPMRGRLVKLALWFATALVAAALAFPYLVPTLLGA
jgi:mercuric ion transport protein